MKTFPFFISKPSPTTHFQYFQYSVLLQKDSDKLLFLEKQFPCKIPNQQYFHLGSSLVPVILSGKEFRTSESNEQIKIIPFYLIFHVHYKKSVYGQFKAVCIAEAAFCEIEHCATLNVSYNSVLAKAKMQQVKLLL